MMFLSIARRLACVLTLAAASLRAENAPTTLALAVPDGDKLEMKVPAKWQAVVLQPTPELPPNVKIRLAGANPVSLQLTWLADIEKKFTKPADVEAAVKATAEIQYLRGSVEKQVTVERLATDAGFGSFATFTDADLANVPNLRAGQYRNVTTGVLVIGKQFAIFTLLSNDPKGAEHQEALRILTQGIAKKAEPPVAPQK